MIDVECKDCRNLRHYSKEHYQCQMYNSEFADDVRLHTDNVSFFLLKLVFVASESQFQIGSKRNGRKTNKKTNNCSVRCSSCKKKDIV